MSACINLLVIEDTQADFKFIVRHLEKQGLAARCRCVSTLAELEAAVAQGGWDAVLSDYSVPQLDFQHTLGLLQAQHPDLPLILVSGSVGEERAVELLKLGVWDFVLKDNLTRLVPAIERSLREATARRERQRAEGDRAQGYDLLANLARLVPGVVYQYRLYPDGRSAFPYASPGMNDIYEVTPEAVKDDATPVFGRLHPEDAARVSADILASARTLETFYCEFRVILPRQGLRWRWSQAQPQRMADGGTLWHGIISDITERKQTESALRKSEEQFRAMFEMACIGMAQADPHTGQWVRVNQQMCAITGYTAAELLQLRIGELTHPDDRQLDLEAFQRVVRGETPDYRLEKRYVRKDGAIAWVNVNMTVIRDAAGTPLRTMAAIEDITVRRQAEAALRESAEKFSKAFQTSPYVITITRMRDGSFVAVNDTYTQVSGYTREETLADTSIGLRLWLREADRQHVVAELAAGRSVVAQEYQFRLKHGTIITGLFSAQLLHLSGDACVLSSINDITARKQAEEALRRYEMAVEQSSDGIAIADLAGRLTLVNQAWARMHGFAASEMIGQNLAINHTPEQMMREVIPYIQALTAKGAQLGEIGHRRKDGTTFETWMTGTILRDDQGQPAGIVGIVRDITEQKRAERERLRLSTAIEQAHDVVVITDHAGAIQYVNPAFEKTTGYTRDEAMGQNPRVLKSGQHDLAFYQEMWATLTAGQQWTGHLINKRKDGTLYEEDATISPVHDGAGRIVNYVAVKRDVTKEVQLEAQMRQAQKMEAVGQLAGGVAHDFNNLLAVINGYAEMALCELRPADPLHGQLTEVLAAGQRAAALTRQLLIFSRKQVVVPELLDLNAVVTNLEKMLRRLIGEHITLTCSLAQELGQVRADAGQLEQVAMNLVVNARDAMPHGGTLDIATRSADLDEAYASAHPGVVPGPYVVLEVSDSGCGMSTAVQARLFEPFFTTKEQGKGTGLGLATVYGIVKQAGGHVGVYSEVGHGSVFRVYLPRVAASLEATSQQPAPRRAGGGSETILLVEDDAGVRELARSMLTQAGYHVLGAANGHEALGLLTQAPGVVHLLLADVVMPGLSGPELAPRLQALRPDLKVLYMSGYTDEMISQQGLASGSVRLLGKPFTRDALLRQVRAVLGGS